MKKQNLQPVLIFLSLLLFLLSSCATILNQPVQKISVTTGPGVQIRSVEPVVYKNSSKIYYVPRGNQPVKVKIQTDSTEKEVYIKPKNSFAFWYNIMSNYGIGMLVDRNNPKRYAYPSRNYIFIKDSSLRVKRFENFQKGTFNFSFSLPFITGFTIKPGSKTFRSAGMFGIEAGAGYFYSDNRYISLATGVATDRSFAEYLGTGYIENAGVVYGNIRNNYISGSFDLGYGINYSQFIWKRQTLGDTINMDQTIKNNAIGLSLSANYRIGNHFSMGVLYQPCFLNIDVHPAYSYQHYISLNMSWKFSLGKRKG